MHPAERVRFAVETARALLEERLDVVEGAAAVAVQVEQVLPHLRGDRDAVTRHEAESVASTLRLLAEQVADRGAADPVHGESYRSVAADLGRLAQALR